jgi:hypothetical protein
MGASTITKVTQTKVIVVFLTNHSCIFHVPKFFLKKLDENILHNVFGQNHGKVNKKFICPKSSL